MKHFVVIGRIPDHENEIVSVNADSVEEARLAFIKEHTEEEEPGDESDDDDNPDDDLIIEFILESDSPIKIHTNW